MARYETPEDPRDSELKPRRLRRNRSDGRDYVPLIGLLLGIVVTIIAIVVAWQLVTNFLIPEPLVVAPPAPTVVLVTAPATAAPTATADLATPTPLPTLTPEPTSDPALPPELITVGLFASVANTGGIGVTVRGGPSTNNAPLLIAPEAAIVEIIGGPTEGSGFTWWQLRLEDGTEGWAAADFLEPAGRPEGWGTGSDTDNSESQ
ncbi:MAG: SH3 domain-containing protein [Anaerolineae bacterium]|nr:SH3 domain-containing protein [Anaerolineae bacterium]MCO5193335.1 SH3 domain-containing protein [Anaerolineae bacterium]MCO5199323.1 SH3 domain-containing protein [Anaerolineae bacterium]MCO5205859.1 SH3 domain-containing protein [Anaerolineae bacterium]